MSFISLHQLQGSLDYYLNMFSVSVLQIENK
jgi:hypothetical protein